MELASPTARSDCERRRLMREEPTDVRETDWTGERTVGKKQGHWYRGFVLNGCSADLGRAGTDWG